ncbi:tripartite tricarboxylate transporter substrate binding protein [Variovorax rhizosphaerae]|uniref:Tripartite tricarboxylate transporter substrate binding protein n=1 Tax=Variovorax rhizosphaerae TaxID=1836200 RepID=A0ABU8WE90_9BURK
MAHAAVRPLPGITKGDIIMFKLHRLLAGAIACVVPLCALAQDYPAKPIKLIVGYAPGGFTDVAARMIATDLQKRIGQTVVVENKAGATGTIGADAVAKSAPDGYTLLLAHQNSNAVAPALFPKLPYDVVKDFTPIALVANTPLLMIVNPSVSAKDPASFIALAKKEKGALRFASSGSGSSQHIGAAMFMLATQTEMNHIPYKGSAQALNDLLSGQVELNFDSPPPTLQFIKAGKLRALAITSAKRSPLLPDVPTMAEAGLPGFEFTQWFGVVGPAGMPAPVVKRLNEAINAGLASPEMKEKLAALGATPMGGTPEEFARTIKADTLRFAKLVNEAKIKLD